MHSVQLNSHMYMTDDSLNLAHTITLNIASTDKLDCFAELVRYVRDIAASYPAPYTLFVSGGIDSQAMMYAWKQSGIPFKIIHVDYLGFNSHDAQECFQFCEENSLEVEVKEFNVIDFLECQLDDYATKYRCASPQICTHMAFSEMVTEGTVVFAGNLPMQTFLPVDNTIFGLQRYATISGRSMIPFFLMQDEQVAKAAILHSSAISPGRMSSYEFKCVIYRSLGIPIVPQASKLTGFEQLKEYYDQYTDRVTPKMKLQHSHLPSKRVFDHLFRNKYLVRFGNHYASAFIVKRD